MPPRITTKTARTKAANNAQTLAAPSKLITVFFPAPGVQPCDSPFIAYGQHLSTTQMDPTALLATTSAGELTGNPVPPTNPFTWAYEFPDPPCGEPLALVVSGTNNGIHVEAVVPFECECP